ncbi:hypothetical protein [Alloscardovia macacae]|nr:hypothetical protein [Alloscardovia macacae]
MSVDEQYITDLEEGYSSLFDGLIDYLQAVNTRIEMNAKAAN